MVAALTKPTRSYVGGTFFERTVGFWAASVFSAVYVIAPAYLLFAIVMFLRAPLTPSAWVLPCLPLFISLVLPDLAPLHGKDPGTGAGQLRAVLALRRAAFELFAATALNTAHFMRNPSAGTP